MLTSTASRLGLAVLALAFLAIVVGCESRSKRVPVAGQVLIDGKPLESGTIFIEPDNDRPGIGTIDAQGRFRMTTYDENDGCVLGTHKVSVTAKKQLSPSQTLHLIPPKYAQSASSGLTVTIDKPTEDLKIELSWGGDKPYVEDSGGAGDVVPGGGDAKAGP